MQSENNSSLPSPCAVCRNLDYRLFEPGDGYGDEYNGINPTRYSTLEFQDLRVSTKNGCSTCDIINRGTRLFWGDYPEELNAKDSDDGESYHLCLERRPGKSLTVFRFSEIEPWVRQITMRIEFFTENGATPLHAAFGHAKAVETQLPIESATESIIAWLTACEQTHPHCQAPLSQLPNRVLNVAGELPKLIETKGSMYGKYITLSHCWGQDPHIRPTMTTSDNIKKRKEGIPPEQLCTLFKDFIDLTRRLRCDFVWIDSLCIIQDDHRDWIKESSKMADVYSNALLNVAATSLPDSSHSLFAERKTPTFPDHLHKLKFTTDISDTVSIRESHRSDHGFLFDGVMNGRWQQAPLLTRAWVLQERLLARRTINFCSSELIWECRGLCTCECMGMDLPLNHQTQDLALSPDDTKATSKSSDQSTLKQLFSQLHQGTLSPQRAYNFWLELVREYSVLQLSKPWDRYHAVAGIADIFNRIVKDKLLAGIWENDMARGLAWIPTPRSSHDHSRSSIAPTWSWMSRFEDEEGQFSSYASYRSVIDNFVSDERLVISHDAPGAYSSFGPCKDNTLNITAAVIPARISIHSAERDWDRYYIILQLSPTWTTQDFLLQADCPGPSGDNLGDGDECFCLLLGRNSRTFDEHAVVLRKCLDTEGGSFNRIGNMEFTWDEKSKFENAEVRRLSVT